MSYPSFPISNPESSCCLCRLLGAEKGPLHTFVEHSSDKWLQKKRLALVSEARDLILSPDHDAVGVGLDLPTRGGSRHQSAAEGSCSEAGSLDWGPEGDEGPLLAEGQCPFQVQPYVHICRV